MSRENYIRIMDLLEGVKEEADNTILYLEDSISGREDVDICLRSILTTVKEIQGLLAEGE